MSGATLPLVTPTRALGSQLGADGRPRPGRPRLVLQSVAWVDEICPMRRHRTTVQPLTGQLLFAELDARSIVLDCVLARPGAKGPALPVTLKAMWPARARVEEVTGLLQAWAEEEAEIAVRITDGARGSTVEIATSSARVVLVPAE